MLDSRQLLAPASWRHVAVARQRSRGGHGLREARAHVFEQRIRLSLRCFASRWTNERGYAPKFVYRSRIHVYPARDVECNTRFVFFAWTHAHGDVTRPARDLRAELSDCN